MVVYDSCNRPLGRVKPTDYSHVEAYPFSDVEITGASPVVAATDWHTSFDRPEQGSDGKWRINTASIGSVRGGHCYCFEPIGGPDQERNWIFYNQGLEGACIGFGNSRALTLLTNNVIYDAFWLYNDARRLEGRYPSGEGAEQKDGAEALRKWGDHPARLDEDPLQKVIQHEPWRKGVKSHRIESFHWATSVEEIRQALGYDTSVNEFPLLNSWGKSGYPHRTYMADETIDILLSEGAEYCVFVTK